MITVRRASWDEEDEVARLLGIEEFASRLPSRPVPLPLIRRAVRRCLINEQRYQTEFYLGVKRGQPFCVPAHRHYCDTGAYKYLCCPHLELISEARARGREGVIRLPSHDGESIPRVKTLLTPDNPAFLRRVERAGFHLRELVLLHGQVSARRVRRWRFHFLNFRSNSGPTPSWRPFGEFVHCVEDVPEILQVHKARMFHLPYLVDSTLELYKRELRQTLDRATLAEGIRFSIENRHRVYGCFYVLTRDGKPIGSVRLFAEMSMWNRWRVYVRRPCLEDQYRGKGLAAPFLQAALGHFWPGGDLEVRTLLDPRLLKRASKRERLLGLFEHLGLDERVNAILAESA
jgi:GNAT superfamily N-acetyltransferase